MKCQAGWSQAGMKISGENMNNLRYADDTTFMAESEDELKGLLRKVKEESEKAGLKLSVQKTKILATSLITLWQIDGETMETMTDFIFLISKITADGDLSHEIKIIFFVLLIIYKSHYWCLSPDRSMLCRVNILLVLFISLQYVYQILFEFSEIIINLH